MKEHADGIYFGLPEEDYHADAALGASDHKRLLASAVRWHFRSHYAAEWREALMGSTMDEEETLAKMFGSAVHTMVLEGPKVFAKRYWTKPEPPPEMVTTKDDLRNAIKGHTGKPPFGQLSREELVLEFRKYQVPGLLSDDWYDNLLIEKLGRIEISDGWARRMNLIARMVDVARPDYDGKSQREHVLTAGYPEVSAFVTIDGVRYKCRFDYLRVKSVVDVKTYSAKEDEESIAAFARSVETYAYDMQAEHYQELRAHVPRLIAEGRVYGDVDIAFLDKMLAYEGPVAWVWLAIQTVGMVETDVLEFPQGLISSSASYQLRLARARFVEFRDRFGMDTPWVSTRGTIQMTDDVFEALGRMRRMQDRGQEAYKI